jgi:hypothetical protein
MSSNVLRHRATVHVEGRNNYEEPVTAYAQTADFEKVLTSDLFGPVSRLELVNNICAWICLETLFHEHSEDVATRIQQAVQQGCVQAAAPGTTACLVGRDTSPDLYLNVQHELLHEGVALAIGSLAVAVDGCTIPTSVQALRIVCALDQDTFIASCHLTPIFPHGVYSECQYQSGNVMSAVRVGAPILFKESVRSQALSHRNRRLQYQADHQQDVLAHTLATEEAVQTRDVGLQHTVLSRKVTLMTSARVDKREGSLHTVFFH